MPEAGLGKVSYPKGTGEWWKVVGKVSDRSRLFWKITLMRMDGTGGQESERRVWRRLQRSWKR